MGVGHPSHPQESLLCGCNNVSDPIVRVVEWAHVNAQAIRSMWRVIYYDCVNLKGILEDAPICDTASSIARSWAVSHTSPPHEMTELKGSILVCTSTYFGSIPMLVHFVDRSLISLYSWDLCWSHWGTWDNTLGTKAWSNVLQELKYNKVLGYKSQHSTSSQACPCTTNRLILPKHGNCSLGEKETLPEDVFLTATPGRSTVVHSCQLYTEQLDQQTSTEVVQ